jgi:hypothetical protein
LFARITARRYSTIENPENVFQLQYSSDLKSSLPEAQFSKLRGVWSETAKRNWNLFVEYKMESQAIDTILLIPYLSDILEDVLKETLIVTRKMNGKNRTTLLNFLGIYLSELSHDTLFPLWCDTLHFLAHRTRKDLFEDLQALTPVIISLGGVEAVEEMASAIQDIGRWWP